MTLTLLGFVLIKLLLALWFGNYRKKVWGTGQVLLFQLSVSFWQWKWANHDLPYKSIIF